MIEEEDPQLSKIREEVLSSIPNYNEIAERLSKKVNRIHSSYLFHPEGRVALSNLCRCMSSTSPLVLGKSWKDFGALLGLDFHQIGCIENQSGHRDDFTEVVLKTFSQKEEASLSNVVKALKILERYDAIHTANRFFPALIEVAIKEHGLDTEETDTGYYSWTEAERKSKGFLLVPKSVRKIKNSLPITLRELSTENQIEISTSSRTTTNRIRSESKQTSSCVQKGKKERLYCKKVMLTFASDGENLAREVAKEFRQDRGFLPVGVLILDEHFEKVMANPESFIAHQFAKMDFIIPILTEGYFEQLDTIPSSSKENSGCLDCHYVQFIHDLMSKYYVDNACRNDKVRCIIADAYSEKVLSHPHMKIDLVLRVYRPQSQIEKLALTIAKAPPKCH